MSSVTRSEHRSLELAVLDSEIEQLPDLKGYLKFASSPEWRRVELAPPTAARENEASARVRTEAKRNWEASKHNEHGDGRGAARGDVSGKTLDGFEP
jgi:hypothetical protein